MRDNLPLFIGLRYSFSRQRNRFIGVVSMVCMLGMALGVASLITVLSVMNGFSGELRDRILALVPHLTVEAGAGIDDWPRLAARLEAHPEVLAAAPYIDSKVLLGVGGRQRGSLLTAVDVQREPQVSQVAMRMISGSFTALDPNIQLWDTQPRNAQLDDARSSNTQADNAHTDDTQTASAQRDAQPFTPQPYGIVLGALQARALGVGVGDAVEVTVPRLTHTPLGSFPRRKRFVVVGIFEVGAQLDGNQAYINLAAGRKLFGLGDRVGGLRLRLRDLFAAPDVAADLQALVDGDGTSRQPQLFQSSGSAAPMPIEGSAGSRKQRAPSTATSRLNNVAVSHGAAPAPAANYQVRDWGRSQGSLFAAMRMEKIMMTVLLLSVVAVAAFNIVSTLVMAVTDKRGDIAVLRTLGARTGAVMSIFVAQGMALACTGILLGGALGVALALNIAEVTLLFEGLLGGKLFNPAVYFISDLPSRLQWLDVVVVTASALALSLLATLYPAWRAARVAPAEVLRYE